MKRSPMRSTGSLFAALWTALLLFLLLPSPFSGSTARGATDRLFERAVGALRAEDWPRVRELAARLRDPVLRDYFAWRDIRDNGEELPIARLLAFLERRPHWPAAGTLRRLLERRLPLATEPERVIAHFRRHPPLTGRGRLLLARALLRTGDGAGASELLRRGWPDAELDPGEERAFRRLFGGRIDRRLEAARLDRLLWRGKLEAARRMLDRVDRGTRRLALARIALQKAKPGVDGYLARVPKRLLRDPGLVHDRLQWRARKGRRAGVREILMRPP
ncbi:MAG TPA: hypothetical protein ENJ38_12785, partial [Rhodospirillales bacterium]|nr:hypothetical protein [Rhodospirillales bacterium]